MGEGIGIGGQTSVGGVDSIGALWVRTEITSFTKRGDDWSDLLDGVHGWRGEAAMGGRGQLDRPLRGEAPRLGRWVWKGIVGQTSG